MLKLVEFFRAGGEPGRQRLLESCQGRRIARYARGKNDLDHENNFVGQVANIIFREAAPDALAGRRRRPEPRGWVADVTSSSASGSTSFASPDGAGTV